LFVLQHFYFPENVPGIFVAFIPISYVVMIKKNRRIGFVFHSLSNLVRVFFSIPLSHMGRAYTAGALTSWNQYLRWDVPHSAPLPPSGTFGWDEVAQADTLILQVI